ncbi:unnamed protein product [Protopolystoma xenopodis]|uniref:Uncharacterized protein n=1 Tax=Protopolystoma xenopodis TaxID=117903 RepID=A0A448XIE9_9PLAT|nr:unnamed protein product [Protopolystoma xenopodis]
MFRSGPTRRPVAPASGASADQPPTHAAHRLHAIGVIGSVKRRQDPALAPPLTPTSSDAGAESKCGPRRHDIQGAVLAVWVSIHF